MDRNSKLFELKKIIYSIDDDVYTILKNSILNIFVNENNKKIIISFKGDYFFSPIFFCWKSFVTITLF